MQHKLGWDWRQEGEGWERVLARELGVSECDVDVNRESVC